MSHQLNQAPLPTRVFGNVRRYWDSGRQMVAAKITPGEYYVSRQNEIIVTALGSCIAACIYDPTVKIGGMNHFMLPLSSAPTETFSQHSQAARFGNFAMELLINELLKQGAKRSFLKVKLFGGGRVTNQETDIGKANIEFALDYIAQEKLTLEAQSLGDIYPRKVVFNPITGQAWQKKLKTLRNETILEREHSYRKRLIQTPDAGDVELF